MIRKLTLSLILFLGLLRVARAEFPQLHSRNMPYNCQFVYAVDSDIQISFDSQNDRDGALEYRLKNEFADEGENPWTEYFTIDPRAEGGLYLLSLQSMSQAQHYLYRKIRFRRLVKASFGNDWLRHGEEFESEFGRKFSEKCFPDGRSSTPYRRRVVSIIEN